MHTTPSGHDDAASPATPRQGVPPSGSWGRPIDRSAQYEDDPPPCDAPPATAGRHPLHQTTPDPTPASPGPLGDPRLNWSDTDGAAGPPPLLHRRDGILPTVAAALSVRGKTLTCTASKGDQPPPLHPLVQDFLDTLTSAQRERFTGRCPEAILLSRHLTGVEANRSKRAARKPLTHGEARRALKQAKITTRRIREAGDPRHGSYAPPCRSCAPLLAHFGVRSVGHTSGPATEASVGPARG